MTTGYGTRAGARVVGKLDDRTPSDATWGVTRQGWMRSEVGANLLETALAVLLIAVVAIAAVAYFGTNTGELWDQVPASFQQDGGSGGSTSGGGSGGGTGGGGGGSGPLCPPGSTDPVCTVP